MKQSASKVAAVWYICNLSPLRKGIKKAGIDWARSCFLSPSFQCSQAIRLAIMRSWWSSMMQQNQWCCTRFRKVASDESFNTLQKYVYIYIYIHIHTVPNISYSTICHTVSIFHSLLHLAIKFPEGLWQSSLLRTLSVLPWFQVRGEGKEWNEELRKTSNRHHVSRVQNQLSSQHWLKTSHPCYISKKTVLAVYSVLYSNSCRVVVICFHVFSSFFPARNKCLGHCFNGLRINRLFSLLDLK